MSNIDPLSLAIVGFFIFIIVDMTFFSFSLSLFPFNKKIGFFSLVSFWKKTKELDENIRLAIKELPTSDYRNNFTKKYHEINEKFSSSKYIFNHLWKEFSEQLVEPTDKEPIFQNSIRPEKFFTLEYLLKKQNINSKLLESMPGILVGLGVLGTFSGLSVSLFLVFPDLAGQNPNLKEAINTLISGASVAFFTSVVGLLCSLIFNFILDKKMSILQSSLNDFNFSLERNLKFVTEEHLLTNHLKELYQHGKYLENMDEKIALKIGDYIEQIGNKVQGAISQGNQNISEKFLSDMANQITQGMGDFSRKQMENLDKTLSALQSNIPSLISKLENSQRENEEKTKELIDYLSTVSKDNQTQINNSLIEATQNIKSEFGLIVQNLKQGMDQTLSTSSGELRKLITSLAEMNQKILKQTNESKVVYQNQLDETAKNLHSFTGRLEKVSSEINDVTSKSIKDAVNNFHQAIELQKEIVKENKLYIHSLNNLTDSLKPIPSSLFEITKKIPELIKQINDSNKDLQTVWNNYEIRFKNVDESAEQIFIKIKEDLGSIAKESADYIGNLNNQTKQLSLSFSSAVDDLKEIVEGLNDYNEKPN